MAIRTAWERLVRGLCAETHETWLEDNRHIDMDLLKEQKKAAMKVDHWCILGREGKRGPAQTRMNTGLQTGSMDSIG